jgi:hypothetical protein
MDRAMAHTTEHDGLGDLLQEGGPRFGLGRGDLEDLAGRINVVEMEVGLIHPGEIDHDHIRITTT